MRFRVIERALQNSNLTEWEIETVMNILRKNDERLTVLRAAGDWISDTINGASLETCGDPICRQIQNALKEV